MKSLRAVVVIAIVWCAPRVAAGQVRTTNCQIIGNQVMCNTQQGVMQVRGWGDDLGKSLGNFANQVINARRQAQARNAYTAALQEAQNRARLDAEAQQRTMEEAALRNRAELTVANEREQARQRLFAEKAINVVYETAEGMRFQGKVQAMWVQAVSTTLQDLYKVKPEASRLEIYDAIAPKVMIALRARDEYMRKHVANEPLFSRFQRLELKALGDSVAYEKFWGPVIRAAEPLFMEWPDEINVERFAAAVEPVYASLERAQKRPSPKASNRGDTRPGVPITPPCASSQTLVHAAGRGHEQLRIGKREGVQGLRRASRRREGCLPSVIRGEAQRTAPIQGAPPAAFERMPPRC